MSQRDLQRAAGRRWAGGGTAVAGPSARQIAAIHAAAKSAGLGDEARRDVIAAVTGKRSSKDLTADEAEAVRRRLNALAAGGTLTSPASTATGRFGPKLRALWLNAWNLGITRSPDDKALIAFVQRQSKVDHTRFLTDGALANPAIEGLKAWIAREAGVDWPSSRDATVRELQLAVIAAQCRKLGRPMVDENRSNLSGVIVRLGVEIRAAAGGTA